MSGSDTLENVIIEYVHFALEEYKYEEVNNSELCDITIEYILYDYQENTYVIENEKAIREFILFYLENVIVIEKQEFVEVQDIEEPQNKVNSNVYLLILVSLFIVMLFKTLTLKQKNQNLQNIVDKLIPERLL